MGHARQPALDGVRGIAILLVLLFHFRMPFGSSAIDAFVQPFCAVGWIGVDLFFVLSGFLVGRLILIEVDAAGALDLRRFFLRRAWRLWPVLGLYLATLVLIGGGDGWQMVWPVLLHVQNFSDHAPSHLWSLAVEEHFYLGAALLLPWLLRHGGHAIVQRALFAVMAVCLLLRLIGVATGVPMLHLQWQTQYRLDAPAFGVLMASISLHRPMWFASLSRHRALWLALAGAGLLVMMAGGEGGFRHGIGFTIAYLSAGAFVVAMNGVSPPPRVQQRMAALAALGIIAYPVYVWHANIGIVVRSFDLAPWLAITLSGTIAIAVGAALHVLVERPAMRRRHHPVEPTSRLNAIASHSL
ncbi:peptidoglycan/LPS O-acetylase OafA/YrhL [Sphingomonas insulae]|uniref:Acyltransferase n=1 Tax=Sphingomonas insulae TaxID=424800 RepID=A0ABP3T596_9SPHN|nr:acyltransferase [Sphingomonas insulae]NIJ29025.1 peptidoglycan/LPS O-acetylase OafA/YrhL [Sphingomonas insulae]